MKKIYELLSGIMEKVSLVSLIISSAVLFFVVLLIFADVIMRYIFNHPISGQQELAELGTVVVVYFGLPYATRIRSHVRVEPITGLLPEAVRSILYGILNFLIVIFMGVLTWKVLTQAITLLATPGNATLILRIPYYTIYFIASVGALIGTLEFLLDGIRYFLEGIEQSRTPKQKGGKLNV